MRQIVILSFILAAPAHAEIIEPQSCALNEPYAMLDFWLGDWEVYVKDNLAGTNSIEKTLKGCAVIERWTSANGNLGMSLFYVDGQKVWKQVWVTEYGTTPGGVKEKTHQPMDRPDQVRFQGRVFAENDQSYLDRTTLTKLDTGRVRQVIEVSMDEGVTWNPVFDAEYRRVSAD